MRLWQWTWVWLVGLGAVETAPGPESAKSLALGAESPRFIDRSDFFDYSDSDQARLLAVAQFIGEKPVIFVNSGMNQLKKGASSLPGPGGEQPQETSPGSPFPLPCLAGSNPGLFHHILVGALVVAFFFLLFQFCTHM
ncbi:fertilization-influencing membrane protein [Rhinolophus sinicus]|uniref:fertilization-influencing membrane protein n=1 Tax=Rhinolophus sinicus TaxID=89399 RepID=UPI003D7BBDB0